MGFYFITSTSVLLVLCEVRASIPKMSLLGWQHCTVQKKYYDGIEASRATIDDDDYPLFYDLHTEVPHDILVTRDCEEE